MIRDLNSNSDTWIQITQGSKPYINNYNNAQGVGNVRYNVSTQSLEAYDGNNWIMLSGYAMVGITPRTQCVLEWAEKRMIDDQRIEHIIKNNPTLEDAYQTYQDAAEKLRVLVTLSEPKNN
jgi:hypothetical protein